MDFDGQKELKSLIRALEAITTGRQAPAGDSEDAYEPEAPPPYQLTDHEFLKACGIKP